MRIRLDIEYDGTNYCGWQRQKNGRSVQQCLEEAVSKATGAYAAVHGSGRTDAGVHALRQTAHFDTETSIPVERLASALNYYLPRDIRITEALEVPESFHARFSATGKEYRYVFSNHPQRTALFRSLSAHERVPLDLGRMRDAAAELEGTHDFAAFCSHPGDRNTVRTIEKITISRDHDYVIIDVAGTGFLHNMVRIIAGTLAEAGKGNMHACDVRTALASGDRRQAGPTAPAEGLFLVRARYDSGEAGSPEAAENAWVQT